MNTTAFTSLTKSSATEPSNITTMDIRINLRLVRAPFLSIMPAIKGWNTADTMFATASSIPTSVLVKPLASRNAAAQACIVQKATKYVEFRKVYLKVQRPAAVFPSVTFTPPIDKSSIKI